MIGRGRKISKKMKSVMGCRAPVWGIKGKCAKWYMNEYENGGAVVVVVVTVVSRDYKWRASQPPTHSRSPISSSSRESAYCLFGFKSCCPHEAG